MSISLSKCLVNANDSILMKLYTVAVYNLRTCMKEDNPGPKYFKGSVRWGLSVSFCDLTHSSSICLYGFRHDNVGEK